MGFRTGGATVGCVMEVPLISMPERSGKDLRAPKHAIPVCRVCVSSDGKIIVCLIHVTAGYPATLSDLLQSLMSARPYVAMPRNATLCPALVSVTRLSMEANIN